MRQSGISASGKSAPESDEPQPASAESASSGDPPPLPHARLRPRLLLVCAAVCVPALLLLVAFGVDRVALRTCVLRGVWVGDVALTGLARLPAERALKQLQQRSKARTLRVRIQQRLFEVPAESLGHQLDVARTLDDAFAAGRRGSWFEQIAWWCSRFRSPEHIEIRSTLDSGQLETALTDLEERAILDPAAHGGIIARSDRVEAIQPRAGWHIDRAAARSLMARHLQQTHAGRALELPLKRMEPWLPVAAVNDAVRHAERLLAGPAELFRNDFGVVVRFSEAELRAAIRSRAVTGHQPHLELYFDPALVDRKLDGVRKKIESPARNATLRADAKEQLVAVPGRPGISLDAGHAAEALLHAAASTARAAELPVVRGDSPNLDVDDVLALNIKQLVAKFTTFHACCQPRVANIHRIADLIDGTIVLPGETLSVNAVVGPRTLANGFVLAPSIEDGEMVDSVGGGISQFATTLFNAVFHGGYDILQRQPHTYYFSRYPMGHEATLGFPKPDLVFRNDTRAGVLLKTAYTDTSITVKLYGDNDGRRVKPRVSPPQDIVDPPLEFLPNDELSPEDEKLREPGQIGWSVIVARFVTFTDGTTKQEQRKVTYKPRPRRVEVHSCRIPKGHPGHSGLPCPEPPLDEAGDAGTLTAE
jgi:vancomycin resistance protein YoaR